MNPVVRAQVKEYCEANGLSERGDSEQFEIYSVYSIINGRLGESIDPLQAHLRGSEFGLDGLAVRDEITPLSGRLVGAVRGCRRPGRACRPQNDLTSRPGPTSAKIPARWALR